MSVADCLWKSWIDKMKRLHKFHYPDPHTVYEWWHDCVKLFPPTHFHITCLTHIEEVTAYEILFARFVHRMMHRSVRKIVLLFVSYDDDTVIFATRIQNNMQEIHFPSMRSIHYSRNTWTSPNCNFLSIPRFSEIHRYREKDIMKRIDSAVSASMTRQKDMISRIDVTISASIITQFLFWLWMLPVFFILSVFRLQHYPWWFD